MVNITGNDICYLRPRRYPAYAYKISAAASAVYRLPSAGSPCGSICRYWLILLIMDSMNALKLGCQMASRQERSGFERKAIIQTLI